MHPNPGVLSDAGRKENEQFVIHKTLGLHSQLIGFHIELWRFRRHSFR
jgi:hypothetical protein